MASGDHSLGAVPSAHLFGDAGTDAWGLRSADFISELDGSERAPTILILDDLDINRRLLRAMLKTAPYRVLEAKRVGEALQILDQEAVDLLILDLMMPEMSGLEFCQRIKSNKRTQFMPVLMLTSVQGIENEIAGISSGADEFLTKPLHPDVVRTRIRAMLRNKAAIDSLEEAETILFALAQAVEKRDKYTGDHCDRLARYSVMLGSAMGMSKSQMVALHRGGYLHDIGKVCVPDAILFKKGSLTEEEWVVMRSHTTKGEEICRPMKTLAPVLPIIRNHHERWDGTGYPDGLKGEEIPLLARILQMADIYDALTTARPYKPALSREEARQIFEDEVKRGWRDPELVALFFESLNKYESSLEPAANPLGELAALPPPPPLLTELTAVPLPAPVPESAAAAPAAPSEAPAASPAATNTTLPPVDLPGSGAPPRLPTKADAFKASLENMRRELLKSPSNAPESSSTYISKK